MIHSFKCKEVMSKEGGGSSSNSTSPYGSMTRLKYEQSSCYFCNEWLDSESFKVRFFGNFMITFGTNVVSYSIIQKIRHWFFFSSPKKL